MNNLKLFLAILIGTAATTLPAFAQNRSNGFTTRPGGALLCPNYSEITDAKAAARALDADINGFCSLQR